jgi:hypothetical protein
MSDTMTHAYIGDIVKSYRDEQGDLIVLSKAAGTERDLDGERCDPRWLRKAVPAWFEWGNVREQHSQIAAGVGIELTDKDDEWYIRTRVTDPVTAHKVETGTLKGMSLGAINVRSYTDSGGQVWLSDGNIVEFSLVDRPCYPTATISEMTRLAVKSAGGDWQPVSSAGEVIARVEETAPEPRDAPPAFDRALALSIAAAVMKKDRAGALKLADPVTIKAVTADGSQDEAPDIATGKEVIRLLGQLIAAEADELAAGYLDETCDITLLVQATDCIKWWLRDEQAAAEEPEAPYAEPDEPEIVYVALSAGGGSGDDPKEKVVEPDGTKEAPTQTTPPDFAAEMQKIADAAVVKATAPLQAENKSLREELAQIKSTAIPGQPFVVAPPLGATGDETAAKAAGYRKIARESDDPVVREAYNALAAQTEQAAHR